MNNIGYLIQLSAKLMKGSLQKRLEEEKFTVSQWAVIKDVQIQQQFQASIDCFTAVSIAERLDMDKPTISGIINRLVEKGFVEKRSHPKDKRAQVIGLTDKVLLIIPKLEEMNYATIDAALNNFNNDEKKALVNHLNKIIVNLRGEK